MPPDNMLLDGLRRISFAPKSSEDDSVRVEHLFEKRGLSKRARELEGAVPCAKEFRESISRQFTWKFAYSGHTSKGTIGCSRLQIVKLQWPRGSLG